MKKRSRSIPASRVDTADVPAVGHAGGVLLTDTVAAGLDAALSAALFPWRKPLAIHDPGKVVLDPAVTLVSGGDCSPTSRCCAPSPVSTARWASDPTVSRCIDALAADAPAALKAINAAQVWSLAGEHAWRRP